VQTEVTDQMARTREAAHVADHGAERHGAGHVDAGDGEQATHVLVAVCLDRHEMVDRRQLRAEEVELA